MERPPQQILDYFYKLSDFNPQKRIAAARELIQNEETVKFKDYMLDRLIKGLASGKTGARLGFSTALSAFLHEHNDLLTADEFLKLVDQNLPLTVSKKERPANAIGQHLVFVALYSANVFGDSLRKIINKHIAVLEEATFLRLSFADSIHILFTTMKETVSNKEILPSSDLLKLLELIETIERESKDPSLYGRFSEPIIFALDDKGYLKFTKKALKQEEWSYKRIVPSFWRRSIHTKRAIFEILLELETKTPHTFNFSCSLMERLFKVDYRKRRFFGVTLKPEDDQLLFELFSTAQKKNDEANRPLEVLSVVLRFIQKAAVNEDDIEQLESDSEEAHKLAAKPKKHSRELIDLCLSLVSRKQRLYRTLVQYIISKEFSLFSTEDIQHVVETICRSDKEIFGAGDEMDGDDGDFKPITEEERRAVQEKWAIEATEMESDNDELSEAGDSDDVEEVEDQEGSEEESMEEIESDDDANVKADPKLAANLKSALGKMVLENDDQSDVEMTEEEMELLDKSLGAALRPFTSQAKKETSESARVFRSKCIEILNSYFAIAPEEAIKANIDNLSKLLEFASKRGKPDLTKKVNALTEMIANRDKNLKSLFVKEKSRYVPAKTE